MIEIGCAALYPITRYGFPYSLDNYLKAISEMKEAGFNACELEINVDLDLDEYLRRIEEVKSVLADNEMKLSAVIGVVQEAFSLNKEAADRTLERYELLCRFVDDINCEIVCICAYMPKDIQGVPGTETYRGSPPLQVRVPAGFNWPQFWNNAVDRFGRMARIAAKHGQKLVIENRVGDFVNTSDGVLKLIEDAGEDNAGCLLDVAHTNASKEHLALVIPKMKEHLLYVHLADNDGTYPYHLPAGKGKIDFKAIFKSLIDIGYAGFANVDFGGVSAEQIWEEVKRGRVLFEGCLMDKGL